MCPVPKPVQQTPDQEANALPITSVEVTTNLDTSVDASNLIQNMVSTSSTEDILDKLKVDSNGRYFYYLYFIPFFISFITCKYLDCLSNENLFF